MARLTQEKTALSEEAGNHVRVYYHRIDQDLLCRRPGDRQAPIWGLSGPVPIFVTQYVSVFFCVEASRE